jgi:signal transduction histidine kinase
MRLRGRGTHGDDGSRLTILLLVVVLVPSACVLWFMNEAVTGQASAARQRVLEAYRGQLRLVRSRIDAYWQIRAEQLQGSGEPGERFAHLVADHGADAVVLLGEDGSIAYPQPVALPRTGDRPSARALAARARVRELLLRGDTAAAVAAIERQFTSGPIAQGRDAGGRIIAADQQLSAQRLFLMGELRALSPNVRLPTEAALRLATEIVEAGPPAATPDALQPTHVPDVWATASPDRRVIALYRTGRLESLMHDMLHEVEVEGVRFIAIPPGSGADAEAIAAGASLPGWQLTFQPADPAPFDAAVRREVMTYVWVGSVGIAVMTILGVTAGRTFRRQLRLTRLKTDLVAAASHELRTPLTSMRVLVDGLLADAEFDPVKTREYLQMMGTENARLSRLIENFLMFSRLEQNRHHFVFAPASPAAVVNAAVDAVRERVPAGCALQVELEPDLPPIVADADALGTAVVNLLDNALKYTPADKRIAVRTRRDGDSVVFEVEDNGIGIPIREQRRIFRRFYRVDQRLSRETSGVGLGLSIVDLIVRAHRGTITVRSESGAGSTFALRVPCAPAGAAA